MAVGLWRVSILILLAYAFSCIMQTLTEGACGPSDQYGFTKKAQTLITTF